VRAQVKCANIALAFGRATAHGALAGNKHPSAPWLMVVQSELFALVRFVLPLRWDTTQAIAGWGNLDTTPTSSGQQTTCLAPATLARCQPTKGRNRALH